MSSNVQGQNVQGLIFFLLTTKLVNLQWKKKTPPFTHAHTLYFLYGAHDCAGIGQGVFMTLTVMVIIDVEIKKNTKQ